MCIPPGLILPSEYDTHSTLHTVVLKHLCKCVWPAFPKQYDLVCYNRGLLTLALIKLALGIAYHANQGVIEII